MVMIMVLFLQLLVMMINDDDFVDGDDNESWRIFLS